MILRIKESKDFLRKLSDQINAFNRTKRYKINLQKKKKKRQLFFYVPVRNMVIKSGKTIILTVASKVKQEQA